MSDLHAHLSNDLLMKSTNVSSNQSFAQAHTHIGSTQTWRLIQRVQTHLYTKYEMWLQGPSISEKVTENVGDMRKHLQLIGCQKVQSLRYRSLCRILYRCQPWESEDRKKDFSTCTSPGSFFGDAWSKHANLIVWQWRRHSQYFDSFL